MYHEKITSDVADYKQSAELETTNNFFPNISLFSILFSLQYYKKKFIQYYQKLNHVESNIK